MYVLSCNKGLDRIYGVDLEFNVIREHTIQAFNQWHKDRMGLTQDKRTS